MELFGRTGFGAPGAIQGPGTKNTYFVFNKI